jgi:hypothetical protein
MRVDARWLGVALALLGLGCARDVFDVDIDLTEHAYSADFGPPPDGTIPNAACGGDVSPDPCSAGQTLAVSSSAVAPGDLGVVVGCDAPKARCFADAHARVAYEVDVLQDDAFVTKVARDSLTFVRVVDLGYTIPKNTLTFELPEIDVYAGPAGTKTETDPGTVFVDRTPPIAAHATFTDRRHLSITDASPARPVIEGSILAKKPFVLVVVAHTRLDAGTPLPGGGFEVDLFPKIRVGLPP